MTATVKLVLKAGDIVTLRSILSTPNPVPLRNTNTISAFVSIDLIG